MSEPQILDHEYDGIREYDNKLPNWWLLTLWGAILFGFGYWFYFHAFPKGPTQLTEYQAELDEAAAAAAARGSAGVSDEALAALASDPAAKEKAGVLYSQYCASCHGPEGQGVIGPNLTDKFWLNGHGKPTEIAQVIDAGVAAKGMPAWGPTLGQEKVQLLAAFVVSKKGMNVPGKPPQGEAVE